MTRRRFLGLSARPPPPGQRSCRGDSGRGSRFLGQNLLGRMGRARGGGRAREPLPRFFFIKKNLPASFPPPNPGKLGRREGGPEPSKMRPQSGDQPPPGPRVPGVPRRARGALALWRQVFPGKPGAPGALRDRIALPRTPRPAGAFQRAGPGGRGAGSWCLQSADRARLTFPRAEKRGSGRATHRVAHAFPAGSLEDPRCPFAAPAAAAAAAAAALLLLRPPPPLK